MSNVHIYQIYYSEETRESLDSGFIPLDNMANERPDWHEYHVIRRYLLNNTLNEVDFYGFLSPKFKQKTGLDASTVMDFANNNKQDADIIIYPPLFDAGCRFLNIFSQGTEAHSELAVLFDKSLELIAPGVNFRKIVMDSRNTIFCNFFIAKPSFWKKWLDKCEIIYAIAEENESELSKLLNKETTHDRGGCQAKVFLIERIASLLFILCPELKIKKYNLTIISVSSPWYAKNMKDMIVLDALKIAYSTLQEAYYLNIFFEVSNDVCIKIQEHNEKLLDDGKGSTSDNEKI